MAYPKYFLARAYKVNFDTLVNIDVDFEVRAGEVYLNLPEDIEQYLARVPQSKHTCQAKGCVSESYNIIKDSLECMACGTIQD